MKYIIESKKLNKGLSSYISYLLDDKLRIVAGYDYENEDPTEEQIGFLYGEDAADPVLEYFTKSWMIKNQNLSLLKFNKHYQPKHAPILEVDSEFEPIKTLHSQFGDEWKPFFEEWFIKNYPEFPVKTFKYI